MEIELKNITEAEKAALADEYDKALGFCADESAEYSLSHYGKMKKIIGARPTPCASIRRKRSRIAAGLVAATMLIALVGCTAAVYKQQIGAFFTEIFEEHIKGSFADETDVNNQFIDEYYKLTYVPEGYELVKENISPATMRYVWESKDTSKIIFEQNTLDTINYFIDNERGEKTVIVHNEYTIYCRINKNTAFYIWSNEKYAMTIYSDNILAEDELKRIIDGICIIPK